jgi:hypothetical protein
MQNILLRSAIPLGLLCFSAALAQLDAAQGTSQTVTGNWTVTIRIPEAPVTENWTIQQKGKVVTGTSKSGNREQTMSGTFDPAGLFMRVDVTDGDKKYPVRATLDGDVMDGSITLGVGKQYFWMAKRTK